MKIELNIKSGYSFLSSTLKIDDIISYALENNYETLGLCDKNVMFGVKEFYNKCVDNNIKPIIGVEFDVEDFIINLYCKDEIGYKNLVKLSSKKNSSKDAYLNIDDLKEYKEGLIAIVPSYRAFKRMNREKILPLLTSLQEIYNDDFYLGKERYNNNDCLILDDYMDTLGFNSVCFNNIVSKNDKDLENIELLKAIEENKVIGYARKKDGFEYASFESLTSFSEKEIDNAFVIKDKCNFKFTKQPLRLAKYQNPLNIDSKEYLKGLVFKGLEKRNKDFINDKKYLDRINYELSVINEMGFSEYFLVVYDYVKYAKEHDILVGPGRGSAASSLVSYCLGITNIDPLKYDLLFERFLNKERKTMPDIDIDFQDNKREQVVTYLKEKYGYKRVSNIVTFSTLSSKQALRDCAKCLGLSRRDLDNISKHAHKCPYNASLKEMYEIKEFKDFINSDEKYMDVFKTALQIEDLPRQTSMHAAGVVLCSEDLDNIVPTFSINNKDLVIQYDMNYVESLGLLKMDILGLRNLTIIDDCLKEIKRIYNVDIDLNKIDITDKNLYRMLSLGRSSGVFQLESDGMRKTLKTIKPETFIDVCNVIALFRPGPRDFIDTFNKRRHGLEKVNYIDPCLKEVLESTYGIIVYQEQILQVACKFAGFSLAKADILRRAMSKKDVSKMESVKEEFISSSMKMGHSLEKSKLVYNLILKFASYGFNKAHSVSYSMISMQMAYLKYYYPAIFFACTMESFTFSNKFNEYAKEAKDMGIKLSLPSVNRSLLEFTSNGKNEIIYGLGHIKGLNTLSAKQIITEARKKPFTDYYDFIFRMSKLTKSQFIALIDAGALDEFKLNRATCKHNLDKMLEYADMFGFEKDGQISFDFDLMEKPKIEVVEESSDYLENEKEVLGYYVSGFPLEKYREDLNKKGYVISSHLQDGKYVNYVGLLKSNKIIRTKKGDLMNIASFVDEDGEISAIIFPRVYSEVSKKMFVGNYYILNGKVEDREITNIIVNDVKEFKLGE